MSKEAKFPRTTTILLFMLIIIFIALEDNFDMEIIKKNTVIDHLEQQIDTLQDDVIELESMLSNCIDEKI